MSLDFDPILLTYEVFDCGQGGEYQDRTDESRWHKKEDARSSWSESQAANLAAFLETDVEWHRNVKLFRGTVTWERWHYED